MIQSCGHIIDAVLNVAPETEGCAECTADGGEWVALRMCTTCGHVGCCNSSDGNHAQKHYEQTGHPVMRSLEADEDWHWCYIDELAFTVLGRK